MEMEALRIMIYIIWIVILNMDYHFILDCYFKYGLSFHISIVISYIERKELMYHAETFCRLDDIAHGCYGILLGFSNYFDSQLEDVLMDLFQLRLRTSVSLS
jgi:hypothetical protein